jgi:hypothetical protein
MVDKIQKYIDDIYILAIEDYILTKLARADRSSIDIDDILQLLINNYKIIDWNYLRYRINCVNLMRDFKEILRAFEIDIDQRYQIIGKKIIKRFNQLNK